MECTIPSCFYKKLIRTQPFDLHAKALATPLINSIMGLPSFTQRNMFQILAKLGIVDPEAWYDLQIILNFHALIKKTLGQTRSLA